ncbi:baculoviral IAP repeat-containing protein 5 [Toxorhynchites rutilus septentrionalis]|uniref:baculoviral IAP repeat-containing protein 5 n=1 Tax=Toxorhynchites rutilus septentrionalis TaxID=329112 RepID=UPI002479E12F|nr:baculoviral IAP repeat-containing protein 5 [Toxorhynchites rutilus septentrionalis]
MILDCTAMNIEKVCLFEKDRINSFQKWPYTESSPCSIQKMAEAGFRWQGYDCEEDTAACFVCGKILDGWEETDNPWEEHKKHAPQCLFVKYGRSEAELTVEEMISLLEVILKERIKNKYNALKEDLKVVIEKKRKEMTKHLTKN